MTSRSRRWRLRHKTRRSISRLLQTPRPVLLRSSPACPSLLQRLRSRSYRRFPHCPRSRASTTCRNFSLKSMPKERVLLTLTQKLKRKSRKRRSRRKSRCRRKMRRPLELRFPQPPRRRKSLLRLPLIRPPRRTPSVPTSSALPTPIFRPRSSRLTYKSLLT